MDIQVIEKGAKFELDVVSKQEGPKTFYFGAGWDNPNGPVDLDIVCALLEGGKLTSQSNFVYFGNKTAPGVQLSTGEGDGDDEDIVINPSALPAGVDRVVVGLACYAGASFATAPNPHFRVVDGANEQDPQIGDVKVGGEVSEQDTVLVGFALNKNADGTWTLENIGDYHQKGTGQNAIKGFGELF